MHAQFVKRGIVVKALEEHVHGQKGNALRIPPGTIGIVHLNAVGTHALVEFELRGPGRPLTEPLPYPTELLSPVI